MIKLLIIFAMLSSVTVTAQVADSVFIFPSRIRKSTDSTWVFSWRVVNALGQTTTCSECKYKLEAALSTGQCVCVEKFAIVKTTTILHVTLLKPAKGTYDYIISLVGSSSRWQRVQGKFVIK